MIQAVLFFHGKWLNVLFSVCVSLCVCLFFSPRPLALWHYARVIALPPVHVFVHGADTRTLGLFIVVFAES